MLEPIFMDYLYNGSFDWPQLRLKSPHLFTLYCKKVVLHFQVLIFITLYIIVNNFNTA